MCGISNVKRSEVVKESLSSCRRRHEYRLMGQTCLDTGSQGYKSSMIHFRHFSNEILVVRFVTGINDARWFRNLLDCKRGRGLWYAASPAATFVGGYAITRTASAAIIFLPIGWLMMGQTNFVRCALVHPKSRPAQQLSWQPHTPPLLVHIRFYSFDCAH